MDTYTHVGMGNRSPACAGCKVRGINQMSGLQEPGSEKSGTAPSKGNSPDIVVNWIQEGLYNGRYLPGQKLVEADLIATLNISRGR